MGKLKTKAAREREVLLTWVRAALDEALHAPVVIQHLQPFLRSQDDVLGAFAAYLADMRAVVLIETAHSYAESLIAELVKAVLGDERWKLVQPGRLAGAQAYSVPDFDADSLLVLSYHEGIGPAEPLQLAHAIDTTDNPVLIGCRHRQDVPEPIRRQVDLRVQLAETGSALFERVFQQIYGPIASADTSGDDGDDGNWRTFVVPTDLQPPTRQGFDADAAYTYVRDRVRNRIAQLTPDTGPGLDDLYGLGEAHDIAADLVEEIRLASQGALDWDELDRGMLMVGPPGTGKTTLARAIAKDSGIKFIAADASTWAAAGTLGPHLAAIRASFAEARRFAPAILFIDEIDSIGNRAQLEGTNESYQVNVINCLLEELDGFEGRGQVFVIAATNHAEQVDPALRRAGRLDQVISIPYPNAAALSEIYRFHVQAHLGYTTPTQLDYTELGRLSVGVSGADVERFVRGAARRARRAHRSLAQQDLVAELLRRPRHPEQRAPLHPEVQRRLAVHEAGHALVRLLGPSQGRDIGYVTIAPRADGSIGHLAELGTERVSMTRADFLHEIRVCLAGRAAEEVVYGRDGVSDLGARYGQVSDLAQATRLVEHMLGLSGLGLDGDLLWQSGISGPIDVEFLRRVDEDLTGLYDDTVSRIRENRTLLDATAEHLVSHQEMTGEMLRTSASQHRHSESM